MSVSWLARTPNGPVKTTMGGKVRYLKADLDAYLVSCREPDPPFRMGSKPPQVRIPSALERQISVELDRLKKDMSKRPGPRKKLL